MRMFVVFYVNNNMNDDSRYMCVWMYTSSDTYSQQSDDLFNEQHSSDDIITKNALKKAPSNWIEEGGLVFNTISSFPLNTNNTQFQVICLSFFMCSSPLVGSGSFVRSNVIIIRVSLDNNKLTIADTDRRDLYVLVDHSTHDFDGSEMYVWLWMNDDGFVKAISEQLWIVFEMIAVIEIAALIHR